jgi:hypothetical protein
MSQMQDINDRLYELLPVVYRHRDVEHGLPLKALLRMIAGQVDIVEKDIAQLYENWFIETCRDWVVPYISDLVGFEPVHEAGQPGELTTPAGQLRNKILIPRREVANTIRNRRRKGTLALLELLAHDAAGWPARAVEFFVLLGMTQSLNHLRLDRGRTVDLRNGDALSRIDGPFDELAHTVDVRRPNSHRTTGRYNVPSVGLFVWRLRSYSTTQAPAYYVEDVSTNSFTFSVLANDTQLYTRWTPEEEPTQIAGEMNLPTPIRRDAFFRNKTAFYGEGKSIQLWEDIPPKNPIPPEKIEPADLSGWHNRPKPGFIAVDPELGRISYPIGAKLPENGLWVTYYYGFSADVGGGEYDRALTQPAEMFKLFRVGGKEESKTLNEALKKWKDDEEKPDNAIIEITDNNAYVEQIRIELEANKSLQIRAANQTRPAIRLLDFKTGGPDALTVVGAFCSRFTLDGLLITGRGLEVEGEVEELNIRHCTLVPGWDLQPDCDPTRPTEPSLWLFNTKGEINIEHSIIGSIQVNQDAIETDPIRIHISDSILDATSNNEEAVGMPGCPVAHAIMTIVRTTVIGYIQTHAIELAENSIFMGPVVVARRQIGCMRFCYITPLLEATDERAEMRSRTPRRFSCQPDLVEKPILERFKRGEISSVQEKDRLVGHEHLRVRPQFMNTRYGKPDYCRLADTCAEEIKTGADDESEMGVFHDLFQPQRETNLRVRLDEYTPAGMNAGIFFAS